MASNGWHEALRQALEKEKAIIVQVATADASSGAPRVRTMGQRGFITASSLPNVPLILCTTDVRTCKVAEVNRDPRVELVFWMPSRGEQVRVLGRALVVPSPEYKGAYPAPGGLVCDALKGEGIDWEKKRLEVFDGSHERMKATWCKPTPGQPLEGAEDEIKAQPESLPKLGEAKSEEDKQNLAKALSNFALFLVEPVEVDFVEVGVQPNRRTRYERWVNGRVVEFKATALVP